MMIWGFMVIRNKGEGYILSSRIMIICHKGGDYGI